jgi:hypothetical protein
MSGVDLVSICQGRIHSKYVRGRFSHNFSGLDGRGGFIYIMSELGLYGSSLNVSGLGSYFRDGSSLYMSGSELYVEGGSSFYM